MNGLFRIATISWIETEIQYTKIVQNVQHSKQNIKKFKRRPTMKTKA